MKALPVKKKPTNLVFLESNLLIKIFNLETNIILRLY